MKHIKHILPSILLLALVSVSCVNDREFDSEDNDLIVFGASTEYENDPEYDGGVETRTEYSGRDQSNALISSSSTYERINWVASKDRIRILCAQARTVNDQAHTGGTFVIGTPTASGRQSQASASPASGTNKFYWGNGAHYFYALYPAAGTTSNYHSGTVSDSNSKIAQNGNTKATVTGSIPTTQSLVKSGNIYKPNMNLAYMYAAVKTSQPNKGSTVSLEFKPLVTAFQFSLKALTDQMAASDLVSMQLESSSTYLFGDFTAALNLDASTVATVTPGSTKGRKITVNFPSGTRLSKTDYIVATVLALGVQQTNLTLTLNFANNTKHTLVLNKKNGSSSTPISVGACKKAYFQLGVDPWVYTFGSLSNLTVPYTGGSGALASGSFKSYRTNASKTEAVSFTLQYSEDGTNWSTTKPAWLTTSGMNTSGGTTGQSFNVTAEEQVNSGNDPHHTELAKSSRAKTNFDLATYNVATGATVSRTTANCYVVRGSGTYKLPLIYGNAIKNNDYNPDAYWARNGVGGARRDQNGEGNYLGRFKDHLDQNITATYITQQHSGKTLTAELLWTDEPGLVKNVGLTGSGVNAYLTFEVPSKYITQGNAVVAVLANGVVAWSWHIWVTDEDLTVYKAGSNGYNFPTVNIGWCDAKSRVFAQRVCYVKATQANSGKTATATITQTSYSYTTLGNSPFYQWGRKDPMWASDGYPTSGTNSIGSYCSPKIYYPTKSAYAFPTGTGLNGSAQYSLGHVGRVSIGTAIQHPSVFYCNVETATDGTGNAVLPADWNSTIYLNKWSSTINGNPDEFDDRYGQDANGKTKTIYDPSPVGFMVPVPSAWSGFSASNMTWKSDNDRGMTYSNGLFFPCAGDRFSWSGAVHYVGQFGYYWTTIPSNQESNSDAHRLMFGYTNNFYPTDVAYRATALSVRPVRE